MARRFDIRKELFRMVALVLVLHGAAVGGYYYFRLGEGSPDAKFAFVAVWTAATLAIVLTSLRRIRLARSSRADAPSRRGPRAR